MNISDQTLLELLVEEKQIDPRHLTSKQMADLYIKAALMSSVMEFVKEQLWLKGNDDKKQGKDTSYKDFLSPLFNSELLPILFLKDFLIKSGPTNLKKVASEVRKLERDVLGLIMLRSPCEQKIFAVESLTLMSRYFINEERDKQKDVDHQGLRLYRTFDELDTLFKLDYQLDKEMVVDMKTTERLYQKSGVGVQSGYSTILLALNAISPKAGDRIIDLGSGYGRVGLAISLLRPDLNFIGYEYVPHRVEIANQATKFFGLQESLKFEVQDLSLETFVIPDADIFYLYDPFSDETYKRILKQIVEIGSRQHITIITKGHSSSWLKQIANENSWPDPEQIDQGNLCIFRSFE